MMTLKDALRYADELPDRLTYPAGTALRILLSRVLELEAQLDRTNAALTTAEGYRGAVSDALANEREDLVSRVAVLSVLGRDLIENFAGVKTFADCNCGYAEEDPKHAEPPECNICRMLWLTGEGINR